MENRDFVLRYALAGGATPAALLTHKDHRGGFFSLLLEPPAPPDAADISPREMVFLLDCSGSMNGPPIEASKAFVLKALETLRPGDRFRVVRFSDTATEFSDAPLAATPQNIRRAASYVRRLAGEGGTNMTVGIRQALAAPPKPGLRRVVVFLADGYIGDEAEVLRLIGGTIGDARLFAFGVGAGVNRYLLSEIGRVGAGFTRHMDPTEDTAAVVAELVAKLQSPVLTDVSLDWGGLPVEGMAPDRIPDLFAGDSVRLMGRFAEARPGRVIVRGRVNGRPAELSLDVTFAEGAAGGGGEALPLTWARAQIARHMAALVAPPSARAGAAEGELKAAVRTLGLDYSLATQWTSFVAVSRNVANPSGTPGADRPVPLARVAGVSALALRTRRPEHLPGREHPRAFHRRGRRARGLGLIRDAAALPAPRGAGGPPLRPKPISGRWRSWDGVEFGDDVLEEREARGSEEPPGGSARRWLLGDGGRARRDLVPPRRLRPQRPGPARRHLVGGRGHGQPVDVAVHALGAWRSAPTRSPRRAISNGAPSATASRSPTCPPWWTGARWIASCSPDRPGAIPLRGPDRPQRRRGPRPMDVAPPPGLAGQRELLRPRRQARHARVERWRPARAPDLRRQGRRLRQLARLHGRAGPRPNGLGGGVPGAEAAMVSFPLLVADGTARVARPSRWLANRSFVGQDAEGRVIVGTTVDAFSLHRFARFLLDAPLGLTLALNLDGGPVASQGVSFNGFERRSYGRWEAKAEGDRARLLVWPYGGVAMPIVLAVFPR